MDNLPEELLLEIMSRLDSTGVAGCRMASKGLNNLYPHLRSLNLQCTSRMYCYPHSRSRFETIFLDLISKMKVVESVCIGVDEQLMKLGDPFDLYLIDKLFLEKWLPRVSVSEHLKSLSVSSHRWQRMGRSYVLPLLSAYCHNLAVLKLNNVCLSLHNLNSMPMMTSLTLDSIDLRDTELIELIKCVPNLQVLNLTKVLELEYPKIHHSNLKIFQLHSIDGLSSIILITPNLIKLRLNCRARLIYIQSPRVSHFHLETEYLTPFRAKKFEYLKTFTLSASITSILHELPVIKTVENLTMDCPGCFLRKGNVNSKFIFGKLFTVFPNVSYLCIKSNAWWVLEGCYKQFGAMYLKQKLKRFSAYLMLVDPLLTFSCVDFVLNECIEVSNVSLLIHSDVDRNISKKFKSECMRRWPRLKWRWGYWEKETEDS